MSREYRSSRVIEHKDAHGKDRETETVRWSGIGRLDDDDLQGLKRRLAALPTSILDEDDKEH